MYERLFQLQEEVLKAIANQKRLEILQLLNNRELTVSEMVAMLGISQSNLSQHLSLLRRLKLVATRKSGLYVYYRLADRRVATILVELREFLKTQYIHEPEVSGISNLNDNNMYPLVKDLVCGMRMSMGEVGESIHIKGEQYFFCAGGCMSRFRANPGQFIPNGEVETSHELTRP